MNPCSADRWFGGADAGRRPALSPDDLLRHSDVGAFAPSSFRARLDPDESGAARVARSGGVALRRAEDADSAARPKERGKYLLRLDGEVWFIAPGAKKPIHLSPSYRLYGGATLDEVLGLRLAETYSVESMSRENDPDGAVAVLELRAKSDGCLFPQVHYVVREATERPVSATYRLRSGREATSIAFFDWNDRGPIYARTIVVKDLLRKGAIRRRSRFANFRSGRFPMVCSPSMTLRSRRALESRCPAARLPDRCARSDLAPIASESRTTDVGAGGWPIRSRCPGGARRPRCRRYGLPCSRPETVVE